MARLKMAAQVCEMLLLLAGIALLSSTEGLRSRKGETRSSPKPENPDDFSAWGIGA